MDQQIPELIGFLQSLGKNPIKKPLHPCLINIFLIQLIIVIFFYKLILLRITSNGWLNVIANIPAKNAG
jgi:hypothetical protein